MIRSGRDRALTAGFGVILAGVAAYAIWHWVATPIPGMIPAGLLLAAGAPLAFLLRPPRRPRRQHPVMISVLSGLGCAVIMVGIQRHGDQYQWALVTALMVLIGWVLYQRQVWRSSAASSHIHPDHRE
ncbi:MAG: hypothetical protein ACLFQ2_01665 [Wenzhouxiangella sp.]